MSRDARVLAIFECLMDNYGEYEHPTKLIEMALDLEHIIYERRENEK